MNKENTYNYSDEMMKAYIILLIYKYLHSHQIFIKAIPMMKGEADARCLSFFHQPFDEKMMNAYHAALQYIILPVHRIIVFIAHHRFYGNTKTPTFREAESWSLSARGTLTPSV